MIISLPLTTGTVFFVSAISVVDYSFLWLLIWVTLKVCGAHSTWILNSVGSLTESMWYKHEDSHNILFLLFRNKYTPYYSSKYKLYWKLDSFFSTATGSDSSKCQVGLEKKKKKISSIYVTSQMHHRDIWVLSDISFDQISLWCIWDVIQNHQIFFGLLLRIHCWKYFILLKSFLVNWRSA